MSRNGISHIPSRIGQPKLASLAEKVRSYLALLKGVDENTPRSVGEEPGKIGFAHRERKTTQIVAAHCQHVEGAELNLFIVLAGTQGVEI